VDGHQKTARLIISIVIAKTLANTKGRTTSRFHSKKGAIDKMKIKAAFHRIEQAMRGQYSKKNDRKRQHPNVLPLMMVNSEHDDAKD
jgi:hypothetical protein